MSSYILSKMQFNINPSNIFILNTFSNLRLFLHSISLTRIFKCNILNMTGVLNDHIHQVEKFIFGSGCLWFYQTISGSFKPTGINSCKSFLCYLSQCTDTNKFILACHQEQAYLTSSKIVTKILPKWIMSPFINFKIS